MKKAKVEAEEREVLDVHGTAALLGIPVGSVYELTQRGDIPARKVGKHWRYRKESLLKWLSKPTNTKKHRRKK